MTVQSILTWEHFYHSARLSCELMSWEKGRTVLLHTDHILAAACLGRNGYWSYRRSWNQSRYQPCVQRKDRALRGKILHEMPWLPAQSRNQVWGNLTNSLLIVCPMRPNEDSIRNSNGSRNGYELIICSCKPSLPLILQHLQWHCPAKLMIYFFQAR